MTVSALDLTRDLVRLDTVNGAEDAGISLLAPLLEEVGFAVQIVPWQPGRSNLVATWAGGGDLVLAGHLDTVPFDASAWTVGPLSGDVQAGRIFGRGSSDMKGGLAAMVVAALGAAQHGAPGFHLAITAAEEVGCLGARAVAQSGLLPANPILVLGESTENQVRLGHKGATWLEARTRGIAAHGSRPDLGRNAIDDLIDAAVEFRGADLGPTHRQLGSPSVNLGTMNGGQQTNLVPNSARMTVDIRTVPGTDIPALTERLAEAMTEGEVIELLQLPAVWTAEDSDLTSLIRQIVGDITHDQSLPQGVSYFTDAAVLAPVINPRVYILGPGDLDQPHSADESCSVDRINEATETYSALIRSVH